jgi:hypothetical protein
MFDTTPFYVTYWPLISAWLAHIWRWIIVVGYVLSAFGLFVIIYCTVRIFELRKRENEHFRTLIADPTKKQDLHPRWNHIETLAGSSSASEWREAIIEADVLLDEVLTRAGLEGQGVGEKLKSADPKRFRTLDEAWEAHKVRNQIAHEGSAFPLSDTIAQRTIARFRSVFEEFGAL